MGIQHRKTNRTHRLWRKHKDAARGEGPKKKHRRGRKPQRQPKNAPKAQREPTSGVYEAAPRPSEEVEGDRRPAPATAPTVRASDSEAGDSTSVYAPATPDRLPPDHVCLHADGHELMPHGAPGALWYCSQCLGQQSSTTVMAKCRHCSDRICPRCVMQIVEDLHGVLRSPEPQGVQRYIEAIAEQRRRDASSINVQEPFALPSTIEELKRRLRLSPAEGFG